MEIKKLMSEKNATLSIGLVGAVLLSYSVYSYIQNTTLKQNQDMPMLIAGVGGMAIFASILLSHKF